MLYTASASGPKVPSRSHRGRPVDAPRCARSPEQCDRGDRSGAARHDVQSGPCVYMEKIAVGPRPPTRAAGIRRWWSSGGYQGRSEGGSRPPRPAGGPGGPGGRKFFRRKKVCKFCVEKIDGVNYKDVRLLAAVRGGERKIVPRASHGVCTRHQRRRVGGRPAAVQYALARSERPSKDMAPAGWPPDTRALMPCANAGERRGTNLSALRHETACSKRTSL